MNTQGAYSEPSTLKNEYPHTPASLVHRLRPVHRRRIGDRQMLTDRCRHLRFPEQKIPKEKNSYESQNWH